MHVLFFNARRQALSAVWLSNLLTRCPPGTDIPVSGKQSSATCRHVTLHFQSTGQLDLNKPPPLHSEDSLSVRLNPGRESNFIAYKACVRSISAAELPHRYLPTPTRH